ncbi:hypothetical protein COMA2_110133 [Candidatus Nitrospira nitrificans]|uniref:Uncharacterized protein n=1 Tax=Candidatus Nitrospira nitrificans TaxID=1742973 RepID=A0A0S4L5Q7_9BACT|nr:hypothetical protein COMA2_110133 [Candidatus Nitrospira nitrificans]
MKALARYSTRYTFSLSCSTSVVPASLSGLYCPVAQPARNMANTRRAGTHNLKAIVPRYISILGGYRSETVTRGQQRPYSPTSVSTGSSLNLGGGE